MSKQRDYLLLELQELFQQMVSNKKSFGSMNTKKLMAKIKKQNIVFDNDDHHDSHEFLSWLLNEVHENVLADAKEANVQVKNSFVTELFEGRVVNVTKCLTCESGGRREEAFLALSVDLEKNTSLSHCLKMFSHKELMLNRDKFYCEECQTKQVAVRQAHFLKNPKAIIFHLKRFKIDQ
mmetsp:Transcript_16056/g.11582  ORF Transcript_16056/g.11582 Transcript_16056/m.11582 type:complete len:179 (+) Transcript_16056:209-745(+)|eukprot:CAMPEP_0202962158 /NCGR_PEP_ID=MMETSP1396-20130829/6264_1 /ASSEMBLY_ACC=CAM_ASM_000872 /TAXON_ID= /ORGANISM="Pseudokeronopsis sp., Strain Brazil" /LENGTH=178 /DNA_ID=CAMNT_0049682549 /DNA_START=208 /DNA_END=744 /DNA_ORIENTATION=-